MIEVYAALREVVSSDDDPPSSDLADAIAALDAINPSSPDWAHFLTGERIGGGGRVRLRG